MKKIFIILCLSMSMLILGACTAKIVRTPTAEETKAAVAQATPSSTVPTEIVPEVDNCVGCHTDKEMLIDTAIVEEEAHEAESEGVG